MPSGQKFELCIIRYIFVCKNLIIALNNEVINNSLANYSVYWATKLNLTGALLGLLIHYNVMILSFWTDMPGQTVQTQIRLLLEEQSDQGLHCLPFRLHCLDSLLYGKAT